MWCKKGKADKYLGFPAISTISEPVIKAVIIFITEQMMMPAELPLW
jgi:hypothetical protein